MPPKASPNTQTASPQPTLASAPNLAHGPCRANSSHRPIPTWIQTVAAAIWTGWYVHEVPPQFTRCRTQAGELVAEGSMICAGKPTGIAGCACRIPSKIHRRPKPILSSRRPGGSGSAAVRPSPAVLPPAAGRPVDAWPSIGHELAAMSLASQSSAKIAATMNS